VAANGTVLTVSRLTRRPWRATSRDLAPVIAGLAILVVWEVGVRAKLPYFVPRPSGIIAALPSVVSKESFWLDALSSCGAIVAGTLIGSVLGAVLGLIMGRVREVGWLFAPLIRTLYSMPLIALVPIMVLWLGYTEKARLVIIVIAVFTAAAACLIIAIAAAGAVFRAVRPDPLPVSPDGSEQPL